MIGHFTDDARVLEFINSNDLDSLAPVGNQLPRSLFAHQDQSAGIRFSA
jgi:rhamnose utilization protein RhaD (predicted bifunctional aldolase and dehydrogenase)